MHSALVQARAINRDCVAAALTFPAPPPARRYLHSALVQTRAINRDCDVHKRQALAYFGMESGLTLALSIFVNMAVVCVFAAGFYGRGIQDIGLENAGEYLGR